LCAHFNGCGEVVPLAADRVDQILECVAQFGAALFELLLAVGCRVADHLARLPAGFGGKEHSDENTGPQANA